MRRSRWRSAGRGLAALLLTALPSVAARAQPCLVEHEPNDTPAEASAIGGASCLEGTLAGRDQDAFRWSLTPEAARREWSFRLEGLPDQVTSAQIYRVAFAADGTTVSKVDELFRISSQPGEPASAEGLLFAAGSYIVILSKSGGEGGYRLAIERGPELPPAGDAEPNDRPEAATAVRNAFRLSGDLAGSKDCFTWALTQDQARLRWAVTLRGEASERLTMTLADGGGRQLWYGEAEKSGRLVLPDLGLEAGGYLLCVGPPSRRAVVYSLTAVSTGERTAEREEEPNGSFDKAGLLDQATVMTGSLSSRRDEDFFRFEVDDAGAGRSREIRLESVPGAPAELCLLDRRGRRLQCRKGERVVLPDLVLAAGAYGLVARGGPSEATAYSIHFHAGGPADPEREREPNDALAGASAMDIGEPITGRAVGQEDDYFVFVAAGEPQLWRLLATGLGLEQLAIHDAAGKELQRTVGRGERNLRLENLYLLPGRHWVRLRGRDVEYNLRAIPLGPPAEAPGAAAPRVGEWDPELGPAPVWVTEREPNDDESRAHLLRPGAPQSGLLLRGDRDVYRLFLAARQRVRLTVTAADEQRLMARLEPSGRELAVDAGRLSLQEVLPPGDHFLKLGPGRPGESPYEVLLEQLVPWEAARAALPVELAIRLDAGAVAAYWDQAQRISGSLRLSNQGGAPIGLVLEVASSDASWVPVLGAEDVTLAAGESREVLLEIQVEPGVAVGEPVRISARARSPGGGQAVAGVGLRAECGAPPRHPDPEWTRLGPLRGGLNVAWTGLGAEPAGGDERLRELFDGLVSPATGWIGRPTEEVTVKLAGEGPVRVTGAVLHPQGRLKVAEWLREFELLLSPDGRSFSPVLAGELEPLPREQVFLLERVVTARFARLRALRSQGGGQRLSLGELKIIALPESRPLGSGGLELAAPERGGHVVYSSPLLRRQGDLLTAATEKPRELIVGDDPIEWVLGFHHDRAARISGIGWRNWPGGRGEHRFDRVAVSVSVASPVGPWRSLGEWELEPGSEDWQRLALEAPAWARFLRFSAPGPGARRWYEFPDALSVREDPAGDGYRSILGEYGGSRRRAVYETRSRTPEVGGSDAEAAGNDSRRTAQPLAPGRSLEGTVLLGKDEDWYRISVPEGGNYARVILEGEPVVAVETELLDEAGASRSWAVDGTPERLELTAFVEPGVYDLRVSEPRRSVVFAWDTSGSVEPYLTATYQSLAGFAADIDPEREVVNLLPYDDPGSFLLRDWSGSSLGVMTALSNYPRHNDSSNSEVNLLTAAKALGKRQTARAVILMTDAVSDGYPWTAELWETLRSVRPRVFTFEISSHGQARSQDLMQDWAAVNDGFHEAFSTIGEFERGFARAACLLRRPAAYRLKVETGFEARPGPGSLVVVTGPERGRSTALAGGAAVEIILDASGSMLQRLEGRRRIDVAKQVLSGLLETTVPAGTPLALRVFGHVEPGACRSDLLLEMKPLDPDAGRRLLASVEAQNLAKTPIADSLLQVGEDLKRASGQRVVILVTDGEETCGGDPAAAVESLQRQGLDVRLNIVGFAIDDVALAEEFESWAGATGGRYFDATGAAELSAALDEALMIPYRVLDETGEPVAAGLVDGEPVALPPGDYTVEVLTRPSPKRETVRIESERRKRLAIDGSS